MAAAQQAKPGVKPYPLTEDFQRTLATMCACRPGFWARIGHLVDPTMLSHAPSKLLVEAVRVFAAEVGRGPDNHVLIIQRIAHNVHAGKLTLAELEAARDVLLDALDVGLPSDDGAVAELRPVIAKQIRDQGIREAISNNHTGDIGGALDLLQRSQLVGATEALGSEEILPATAFQPFDAVPPPKLSSGIYECDMEIGGGFEQGQLLLYASEPGIGKSMTLNQFAICATLSGLNVAYATLELAMRFVRARYLAGVTDQAIDDVLADATHPGRRAAEAKLRELAAGGLGRFMFKEFTAGATTVMDLKSWLQREEQRLGMRFDVVCIDTLDHVEAPPDIVKNQPHHRQVTHVYRSARVWAREENRWLATASQLKVGSQDGKKKAGAADLADSAGKGRETDSLMTFKLDDSGNLEGWVAKNRNGVGLKGFGPLTTAYARGQIAPIAEMVRMELLSQAQLRRIGP